MAVCLKNESLIGGGCSFGMFPLKKRLSAIVNAFKRIDVYELGMSSWAAICAG